tara:strand:- start:27963 stop:28337 length:375 start_codon:yes stop_codon:yes gene_type:complete
MKNSYYLKHDLKNKFKHVSIEIIKIRHSKMWFSEGAMNFFDTVLDDNAFFNRSASHAYFVTSEAYDKKSPRKFTIRKVSKLNSDCEISTHSKFQEYNSLDEAYDVIYHLLIEEMENQYAEQQRE